MHEILLRRCEIKSVLYILVRGSRDEKIKPWVFAFNVPVAFSKPIHHFLANSSSVTKWCLSFVIVAYPFLVIYTFMLPNILSIMRSWANPIEKFTIALSKSWMLCNPGYMRQAEHRLFEFSLDWSTWGWTRYYFDHLSLKISWRYILIDPNCVHLK